MKSRFWDQLLRVVPLVILTVLMNVFITFTCATVLAFAALDAGIPNYLALSLAVLTACGVHSYIVFNHKIREHIKDQGARNE